MLLLDVHLWTHLLHSPMFSSFILKKKNVAVAADGIYFLRVEGGSLMKELKRNCYIASPLIISVLLDSKDHSFFSFSV